MKPDPKKFRASPSRVWHWPLAQRPATLCVSVFFYGTIKNRNALKHISVLLNPLSRLLDFSSMQCSAGSMAHVMRCQSHGACEQALPRADARTGIGMFQSSVIPKNALLRNLAALCLFFFSLALLSSPALASTANDIFGQTSPIRKLVAFMTGPFAFLVVIVGIVIMGSMLIFGNDLSGFGRRVLLLVLGGGLVLGSIQVVSKLFNAGRQAGALYAPGDIPPMDWPGLRPGNPASQPPEAALHQGSDAGDVTEQVKPVQVLDRGAKP